MNKLINSMRRLQGEYSLSDEEVSEGLKKIVDVRGKRYLDAVNKKYGSGLVNRAWDWIQSNLSPAEISEMSAEEWIVSYMQNNPKECTSSEISKALGRGEFKKLLHNPIEDEVDVDRFEQKEDGSLFEHLPKKQKPSPPSMPSREKLKNMSLDEIGKLISESHKAGVGEE